MKRILLIFLLFSLTEAMAQRFDFVERRNPWNASRNAAGIRQDSLSRSYAEVYMTKENGGFAGYSASDDSWNAGARTESIRHFDKISFAGHFVYDYFDGRNMCGSMFVDPGFYPVDILEFTPGRKIRESYGFMGGVAAVLGKRWTGGLKIDFEAQNYAKRKDLRHKNTRLDFEIAPGVVYHTGRFAVGAAYIFGKNSERIEAKEIGTTPDSYEAFFDKGLAFGVLERWDGSSIHLSDSDLGIRGFPVKEITQGVSVQVQQGVFYADATYRDRKGETGEKGAAWYQFDASQLTANVVLSLGSDPCRHFVRLNADWFSQDNRESIIRKENVNGIITAHNLGSVPVAGRRSLDMRGEYEWITRRIDLRAGVSWAQLDRQSTLLFPYVREQDMHAVSVFAHVVWTLGSWELTTAADFLRGGFSEREREFHTDLDPDEYPMQLTDYYNYANEYFTAPRVGAELGLRRNIKRFYVDLAARYEHGFDLRYIPQANRIRATLGVGYNF